MLETRIACPSCNKKLKCAEPVPVGTRFRCPSCQQVFTVQEKDFMAAAAPAAPSVPPPAPEPPAVAPPATVALLPPAPVPAAPPPPAPAPVPVPAAAAPSVPVVVLPLEPASASTVAAPRRPARFVSFLHERLPKPVLFGLYGAVGALLGLLLMGELVFALLHPPRLVPEVALTVPDEITVFPGSETRLPVKIGRRWFKGPVTLKAANLSEGIQITEVTIPEGVTEAELDVKASPTAKLSDSYVQLLGEAKNANSAKEDFIIKVSDVPPSLQVAASPAVAVYAGERNHFTVKIARDLFKGQVRLEVLDLPEGVQIPMVPLAEGATDATLDVIVAKTAIPNRHRLLIEARSLADHKIRSTDTLWLNIEPPPGKLQVVVGPQITVFPGEKNRFTARIARQDFQAPVEVEVEGLPEGVRIDPVTIPQDKAEAEMVVNAESSAKPGTHSLRVRAKAPSQDSVTGLCSTVLRITPPPPVLQLAVSPKVSVYPGGKAKFAVKIVRQRFESPIRIIVQDVNGLVVAAPVTIPADETDAEVELSPTALALSGGVRLPYTGSVQVIARDLEGKGAGANEPVQVEILAPPSDLQLTVSPEVEAYQGGKFRFTVKAARAGFVGPIQFQFSDLPDGVSVETATGVKGKRVPSRGFIPARANEVVLEGRAALRTVPMKYTVKIEGTGPTAPDGKTPSKSVDFNLTIKALPPEKRPPPIDAVFVLDVTDSMDEQIKGLRDGIGQFLGELKNNELDARVGLVAFRDITFDEVPMQVLKFGGEPFTTDPAKFSTEVAKLKAMGGGDDPESSMEGLAEASRQPFRPGALRVLLLITDALPQTKGNSLKMAKAIEMLKEKKIDQIHLIVNPPHRPTYEQLRAVAKGGFFDLKEASTVSAKNKGFASLLPQLSQGIADTIDAAGPAQPKVIDPPTPTPAAAPPSIASEKPPPPRAATPPTPPPVPTPQSPVAGMAKAPEVAPPQPPVAAVPSPPRADSSVLKGLQSTQSFPEEYGFQLLAAIALWTAALAGGIGLALVVGQKLYLQQVWPRWTQMGKAVLAGLAAGLLGGVIGQSFFQTAAGTTQGGTAAMVWEVISRVLAWALLGGLLGAGMSFFVPNLRWQDGFKGGCLGGVIGALGFALFTSLAGPALGRWIGAALLGFFIGMMIALAEKAFRRYWLEVRFGAREIRTFTLGPALVAVGGDEHAATVYVSGAAPRALGYCVRGSRVYCEDFVSGKTTDAPPGDQRKLAHAQLTVHSDASATPTGASLELLQVRQLNLLEGMPLTTEDLPGLEPQGSDGVVALVSRRPSDPKALLLRNRSKQPWVVTDQSGEHTVNPGQSAELSVRCQINFGQVKGTLDLGQG